MGEIWRSRRDQISSDMSDIRASCGTHCENERANRNAVRLAAMIKRDFEELKK
jgi:hypothetical protein